ncbi:MAG: hypothetical protein HGA66_18545 [Holophaga sp.]|nr:hypothetical protein [Holophaga sp.]
MPIFHPQPPRIPAHLHGKRKVLEAFRILPAETRVFVGVRLPGQEAPQFLPFLVADPELGLVIVNVPADDVEPRKGHWVRRTADGEFEKLEKSPADALQAQQNALFTFLKGAGLAFIPRMTQVLHKAIEFYWRTTEGNLNFDPTFLYIDAPLDANTMADAYVEDGVCVNSGPFTGVPNGAYAYFVHSYYCAPDEPACAVARTDYVLRYASVIRQRNVWGIQCHPEKSQAVGLRILHNFVAIVRARSTWV